MLQGFLSSLNIKNEVIEQIAQAKSVKQAITIVSASLVDNHLESFIKIYGEDDCELSEEGRIYMADHAI